MLHPGHFNLFVKCRALVGRFGKVIVAIDSEEKAKKDKGNKRPYYSFEERKHYILSLVYPIESSTFSLVDEVFGFETNQELYQIIKQNNPTYIIKGSDWKGNVVGSDLSEVIYQDLFPKHSITELVNRIEDKK